jgi:hypothetical protein
LPAALAIEDKQDKCRGEEHCYPTNGDGTTILWPSRPGQPQHQWEPPRIVAHSNSSEQSEERGDDGEMPKVSSEQWSDQCAALFRGEGAAMGNPNNNVEFDVSRKQYGKAEQPITSDSSCFGNVEECNEIKPEVGGNIDGTTIGVDLPSMSSISNSELVEILDWMVKGESRVDELRLLGNGVFPSTSEKAFRTLFKELIER